MKNDGIFMMMCGIFFMVLVILIGIFVNSEKSIININLENERLQTYVKCSDGVVCYYAQFRDGLSCIKNEQLVNKYCKVKQ